MLVKAQEGWIVHTEGRISVKFPSSPVEVEGAFAFINKDSVAYVLKKFELSNSDSLIYEIDTDSDLFAYRLKEVFERTMGVEFQYPLKTKWNNLPKYESNSVFLVDHRNVYTVTIVVGAHFYNLMVYIPEGKSTEGKDLFFFIS